MTVPQTRRLPASWGRSAILAAVVSVASAGAVACGDDPFRVDWIESPDTVTLHALASPMMNVASAFDFINRMSVRVETPNATGNWDVVVDARGGQVVLIPPGALGVASKSQVAVLPGRKLADVTEAPADTALYSARVPVPAQLGNVYVWRTRQSLGSWGMVCVYYAKMEPLAVDPAGGTLTFAFDASPVCNDRSLVPPKK